MKITYGQLRNPYLLPALSKLNEHKGYDNARLAYNVVKVTRLVHEEWQIMAKLELDFLKSWVELDEHGEIKVQEGGKWKLKDDLDDVKKAEFTEKFKDFLSTEVEIDRPQIAYQAIHNCPLTPLEVDALEPFVNGLQLQAV